MLRFVVLVGLIAAVAAVGLESEFASRFSNHWVNFKRLYGKHYNIHEDGHRQQIFRDNLFKIINHNVKADLGGHSYKLAINRFADMSTDEFKSQLIGYTATPSSVDLISVRSMTGQDLPDSIDWRTKGLVTPVKDQGQCGSALAYGAVAAVEGQHAKATGQLVELSAANVADCCNASLVVFECLAKLGGVDTEASYPSDHCGGPCRYKKENRGAIVTGQVNILPSYEEGLHRATATVGPITVGIDATYLQFYFGGIFDSDDCSKINLNHVVAVVGYGTENGKDYWILKNSWGQNWGEKGYVRLARGKNTCGVATSASYPLAH